MTGILLICPREQAVSPSTGKLRTCVHRHCPLVWTGPYMSIEKVVPGPNMQEAAWATLCCLKNHLPYLTQYVYRLVHVYIGYHSKFKKTGSI